MCFYFFRPSDVPVVFAHNCIVRIMWENYVADDLQGVIRDIVEDIRQCTSDDTLRAERLAIVFGNATWEALQFFAVCHKFTNLKSIKDRTPARIAKKTWIQRNDLARASKLIWNFLTPEQILNPKYFNDKTLQFFTLMGAPLNNLDADWTQYLNPADLQDYDQCVASVKQWVDSGKPATNPTLLRLLLGSGNYRLILHFMRAGGLSASGTDVVIPDVKFPRYARQLFEYFEVILLLVQQGCDSNVTFDDGKSLVEKVMDFTPILDKSIFSSFVKLGIKWPSGDLHLVKYAIDNGAGAMELKYFLSQTKENQVDDLEIWDGLLSSARLVLPDFAVPLTCDLLVERRIIPNANSLQRVNNISRLVVLVKALPLLSDHQCVFLPHLF